MSQKWDAPFDPAERKDYVRDWSLEMAKSGDTIATVAFQVPADAAAAGLQVASTAQQNGVLAVAWFNASDPAGLLTAFGGKDVPIGHTITTANNRTLHETCILKIRAK